VPKADWTELGHPEIDQEHRALARIVGELESAVEKNENSGVMALLEQLASYSKFHFQSEERAMKAARFPGMDEHTREHRGFSARITLFQYQLFRSHAAGELLDYVRSWFRTHTMASVEKFAEFLREQRRYQRNIGAVL